MPHTNNSTNGNESTALACPACGTTILWSTDFPERPFCSRRCRQRDFIGWANEEQRIAGNPIYDDVFSENDG